MTAPKPKPKPQPVVNDGELSFNVVPETKKIARAPKPNPFLDPIRACEVGSDTGFGFDVPPTIKSSKITGYLDRAGRELNVTVRREWTVDGKRIDPAKYTGNGIRHVFVKVSPKITRPRSE